jgi:hypothetical protein
VLLRPRSADREAVQVEVAAQSATHDEPQRRSSSSMEYAPAFHRVDGRQKRLHVGNADAERQPPSPHIADETDNESARRPDTRQYVAASSGTGKTHIGLGLGLAACQKGFSVGTDKSGNQGHGRRQLLSFAVTRHPTVEWLAQQIVEVFPWETAPTYLVRDNDGAYERMA